MLSCTASMAVSVWGLRAAPLSTTTHLGIFFSLPDMIFWIRQCTCPKRYHLVVFTGFQCSSLVVSALVCSSMVWQSLSSTILVSCSLLNCVPFSECLSNRTKSFHRWPKPSWQQTCPGGDQHHPLPLVGFPHYRSWAGTLVWWFWPRN